MKLIYKQYKENIYVSLFNKEFQIKLTFYRIIYNYI